MSKPKDFLENFKLKKALGDYKASLNYGDKLHMFNCLYKVVICKSDGYTYLEDEKNSRFAIPTQKLALLMKNGIARNYGAVNLAKAQQIGGPSRKIGVTHAAANAAYSAKPSGGSGAGVGSGKRGPQGEPVGTEKQGGDGEWYKKISDNPSQWVHVGKGSSHSSPGGEEHHPLVNKEDQEKFLQIRNTIKTKTKPEDHEKLESLAMDWVKQTQKYKNMQSAHNVGNVDEKGQKLPHKPPSESQLKNVYAEQDKAIRLKEKLKSAMLEAKKD